MLPSAFDVAYELSRNVAVVTGASGAIGFSSVSLKF